MDIVVLWVDGQDPKWLDSYRQFNGNRATEGEAFAARYKQAEELRFALRSIEKNAPWVRRIFLVHDDMQQPPWLRSFHDRLTLIPHSAFIPSEFLPTFSSYVIESFVHRIPGLFEDFVCTNDDTFLIRPSAPSTFFVDGKAVTYLSEFDTPSPPLQDNDPPWVQALKNAEQLLGATTTPRKNVAHGYYSCKIRTAERAWHEFPDALVRNARSRTRSSDSIAFLNHLVPYLMIRDQETIAKNRPFVRMHEWTLREKLSRIFRRSIWGLRHPAGGLQEIGLHLLHPPRVLCINAGEPEAISAVLSKKFPSPSAFER
ncbi:MAG: stealth family protein [Bdellovibrionota bacterium]